MEPTVLDGPIRMGRLGSGIIKTKTANCVVRSIKA